MNLEVRLSDQALSDIQGIGDMIAASAPETAARWVARLREKIATLSYAAHSFEILYSSDRAGREVRQTFFGVYRILYEVKDGVAYVVTVRHGARRPIGPAEVRGID